MRRVILLLASTASVLGWGPLSPLPQAAAHARTYAPAHSPKGDREASRHVHAACRRRVGSVCRAGVKANRHVRRPPEPRATAPSRTLSPRNAGAGTRAGQIAAVLATPCENTGITPEPANLGLVRAAVLCLVNRQRAQNGETPLRLNAELTQAAEAHDQEMLSVNYFAHVSPSGETPVERIRGTGYIPGPSVGYVIGENLAWGTYSLSTPAAIVAAWVASPGHLANILESQYRETGIGVTPQVPSSLAGAAPGATYAQEFGVIIH